MRWHGPSWEAPVNDPNAQLGHALPQDEPTLWGCKETIAPNDQAIELPWHNRFESCWQSRWFHLVCAIQFLGGKVSVEGVGHLPGLVVTFAFERLMPRESEQRRLRELRQRLFLAPVTAAPEAPSWPGLCSKCCQENSYDTGLDGGTIWCSNPNCPEAPPEGWEPS